MKIDFQLTVEDYIEFNTEFIKSSETMKKSMFIYRYVVSLMFLVAPFVFSRITEIPFLFWMGSFVIAYILWVVFYPRRIIKITEKRILKMLEEADNSEFIGEQSLSLTEDGIEKKSKVSEQKIDWISVQRITETKNLIIVYVSAVSAYIIPVRFFSSAEEKDEFLEILNSKVKTSRNSSDENPAI